MLLCFSIYLYLHVFTASTEFPWQEYLLTSQRMTHIEILLLGYDIMRLKYDLRVPIISGGMTFCRNSTERVQREREKEKE